MGSLEMSLSKWATTPPERPTQSLAQISWPRIQLRLELLRVSDAREEVHLRPNVRHI